MTARKNFSELTPMGKARRIKERNQEFEARKEASGVNLQRWHGRVVACNIVEHATGSKSCNMRINTLKEGADQFKMVSFYIPSEKVGKALDKFYENVKPGHIVTVEAVPQAKNPNSLKGWKCFDHGRKEKKAEAKAEA